MDAASPGARAAASLVHVYTASGVVLALLMVHWSYQGRVEAVLWLFLAAMVIDGTDGFLARRFRVKAVTPNFDGALLDNIVDYITYVFAPMVLLWANGYLPSGTAGGVVAAVPLLASCYQFCRIDAKTDDNFFLGFPSYWNVVAFYAVVLSFDTVTTTVVIAVLTVLVFVPVKYVYPSRTEMLWTLNMVLSGLWLAAYAGITALLPDPPLALVVVSLLYVAYYVAVSVWLTMRTAAAESAPGPARS